MVDETTGGMETENGDIGHPQRFQKAGASTRRPLEDVSEFQASVRRL